MVGGGSLAVWSTLYTIYTLCHIHQRSGGRERHCVAALCAIGVLSMRRNFGTMPVMQSTLFAGVYTHDCLEKVFPDHLRFDAVTERGEKYAVIFL